MPKIDIYQEVTDTIIAELEKGAAPWIKPWTSTASPLEVPHNAAGGNQYRGINTLLLWIHSAIRGFDTPAFVTFKQAKKAGGHVRKGERGSRIVYWSTFDKQTTDDAGDTVTAKIPFVKYYTVFNVEQCDELPEAWSATAEPRDLELVADDFQAFVDATGADIRHKGANAFYAGGPDYVQMPHPEDFQDRASYQATLLHELSHWTGAEQRLNRTFGKRFGDKAYAAEELVAEMGAAFCCAHLGIQGELRHAGYLQSWIKCLKSDKRAIFTAAARAGDAADYLRKFSEPAEEAAAA